MQVRRARSLREVSCAVLVALLLAVAGCSSRVVGDQGWGSSDGGSGSTGVPVTEAGCVVAAAGDIAGSDYEVGAARTARLITSVDPDKVLALGDLAYPDGTPQQFAEYYDPTWGAFKEITAPAPGNHEYESDGKGYFDYFDVPPNYSFDLCGWRVVSVDQYADWEDAVAFIRRAGAVAGDRPMLAFWHEPRFSSGIHHGSNPRLQPLWQAAVDAGVDVALSGHDHNYERFEPLDANGAPDERGTVQFVSGNGGHNLRGLGPREPHSAVAIAGTPGVLFLTLRPDGYDWTYRDVEGRTGDSGSRTLA